MSAKTWYRPGLIFKAGPKEFGHQECCRSEKRVYAVDGTVIDVIPALWAEFGTFGEEYAYETVDGGTDYAADIRGGFFDLDAQAEQKGWGDEEKEIVARHMIRLVEQRKASFSLYSKPPIPKPWPTIDTTHAKQVPGLAEQLGLSVEALAWVEENKPTWTEAISLLREQIKAKQAEASIEESLTAA